MFDKRLLQHFDWWLALTVMALCCVGILSVYSAVATAAQFPHGSFFVKQLVWFCIGLILTVASFLFNYKSLEHWANLFYAVCVILLVSVFFFGKVGGGG